MYEVEPGDLVITEVMYDPSVSVGDESDNEWFEIYNNSIYTIDLDGIRVGDESSSTGAMSETLELAAGEYAVLARGNGSGWGYSFTPDGYYGSSPAFNNSGDVVRIFMVEDVIIDQTANYGSLGGDGVSISLAEGKDATDNDDIDNWCESTASIGGDFGTPGAGAACE